MAVKEGKWRCPSCDAVNLGREMKCSSCGMTRGEDVKFFVEVDAQTVEDQNLLNRAQGGADWHCDFCGTDNRADETVCSQCAAPATGMQRRKQQTMDANGQAVSSAPPPPPATAAKKNPLGIILIILGVVVALGLVFLLTRGKEDVLRLDGGEWSRTIGVEEQQWVRHEAWRDEVPSRGRVLRTWEEQRSTERIQVGTEQVKTGTKDLGNGFFEDVYEERPIYEEQPVYDLRTEYEIQEWIQIRELRASGDLNDPPQWPDAALRSLEREGNRSESAVLYFLSTDPEKQGELFSFDLLPEEMSNFKLNTDYKAMVSGNRIRKFVEDE
ncbi:MAG: hypothetical protein PF447_05380 [Spirochaetaceae bacterium]|jgi:hypothetical protein|nr:hypothetical protein [Spirochaetaceae bacterium]